MAVLRAYPKGSIDSIEWTLDEELDPAEVGGILLKASRGDAVSLPTTTGWAIITPDQYAAFEVVT